MAPLSIKIGVESFEAGKAEYLPLGAKWSGGVTGAEIVLRLRLKNTDATIVNVTGIKFSFLGSVQPAFIMKDVNLDGSLNLAAGASSLWSNGAIAGGLTNAIYLTGTPPPQIRIDITAKYFTDPATLTLPLAPHNSPVAGGAYRFIFATGDLRASEFMQTSAVHWANGSAGGTQIFAHDISAVGWDQPTHTWSETLPGTDSKKECGLPHLGQVGEGGGRRYRCLLDRHYGGEHGAGQVPDADSQACYGKQNPRTPRD